MSIDPNRSNLLAIAVALGPLRDRVVFVGGSTAGLLISDPAASVVRATVDVDAILAADSLPQLYEFEAELVDRGFARDAEGGVICRWRHMDSGVPFDLMPSSANVLGFANRWYPDVVETASEIEIGNGIRIRSVSAPAFVATKFEAFSSRGHGDLLSSHDVEDILNVVDGREELIDEIDAAAPTLRDAIRDFVADLLRHRDFENGLPGLLADPDRSGIVRQRLRRIAQRE
jgi:hypothetical protein